jgi:hypothetical protein
MLWSSFLIYLNYGKGLEFRWVSSTDGFESLRNHSLIYTVAFAVPLLVGVIVNKRYQSLRNPWFWIIALVSPWVFAYTSHFDFLGKISYSSSNYNLLNYNSKSSFWISQVVFALLFSGIIWYFKDRKSMSFYGFKFKGHALKPYWIMLAIMLVPILIAGTAEGFLHTYPRIKSILYPNYEAISLSHYIRYELAYGINFLGIEVFFRGFLVMAMAGIIGKEAILPMAVFYVTIHFGKPMGECISSFFGGSLLGIISYHTNSIKGGLLVHVGIAWLMEISGALGLWVW